MATMVEAIGTGRHHAYTALENSGSPSVAKNIALFFAAPFIGLAYIIAFPFVGMVAVVRLAVRSLA